MLPVRSGQWGFCVASHTCTGNISTRILTGAVRVHTNNLHEERYVQPPPPPPPPRLLDVDGLTQSIEVNDDYWGAREGIKGSYDAVALSLKCFFTIVVAMWYRLARADIFLFPFEIGNVQLPVFGFLGLTLTHESMQIESVKHMQEHFRLTKGMFLTHKYVCALLPSALYVQTQILSPSGGVPSSA